jgi:hypothetical protein
MQVAEALERVPENKRPTISDDFLAGFGALYPEQPLAICCWEGMLEAEPLLWWYEPTHKDRFFVPTMDAHDGGPPQIEEVVRVDHTISTGAADNSKVGHHFMVRYEDTIPSSVKDLLPNFVYSTRLDYKNNNGDMFIPTNKLGVGLDPRKWRISEMPTALRGPSYKKAVESKREFDMYGWA